MLLSVEKCTQNHPEHTLGLSHPGAKLKPVLVTIFKMKSSRERGTFLVQRAPGVHVELLYVHCVEGTGLCL